MHQAFTILLTLLPHYQNNAKDNSSIEWMQSGMLYKGRIITYTDKQANTDMRLEMTCRQ